MAACLLLLLLLAAVRSTPKNRFSPGAAKRRRVGRKLWALPRGCYGRPCRCTASEVLAKVVFTIFWGRGRSVLSETREIPETRKALGAVPRNASSISGDRGRGFWPFWTILGHSGSFRVVLVLFGHSGTFLAILGHSGIFRHFFFTILVIL